MTGNRNRLETHVDMLEYFTLGYNILIVSERCQFHIQMIARHITLLKFFHDYFIIIVYINLLFSIGLLYIS